MKPLCLLPAFLLILLSCKKQDTEPELPAETQTGANTFGCRFNGKAWIPEADKPRDYDNILSYEFGPYRGSGYFQIRANSYTNGGGLILSSNIAGKLGIYPIDRLDSTHATVVGASYKCKDIYDSNDKDTYCQGSITLTRVDYRAGILSGTFAFTIHKLGCDTLKVTDGRFDLKTN